MDHMNLYNLGYPDNLLSDIVGSSIMLPFDVAGSLEYILTTLPARSRRYLHMHYAHNMTYADIADAESLTRQRVQQLITQALQELKQPERMRYITRGVSGIISESTNFFIKEELEHTNALIKANLDRIEKKITYARAETTFKKLSLPVYDKIQDLALSTRTKNALLRTGLRTVADVSNLTYSELLSISQLGEKGCYEVLCMLAECERTLNNLKVSCTNEFGT